MNIIAIPVMGGAILILVVGLMFVVAGVYSEMQGETPPEILGYDFSALFGSITPLIQLGLNPFFTLGLMVIVAGDNSLMTAMQLSDQGVMTIPYDIRVERHRDSEGHVSYKVHYSYLDDYRGVASLTIQQFNQIESRLQFLTNAAAHPRDVIRLFVVQYLENDPTYHRLWETGKVPETLINANKPVLAEELGQQPRPVHQATVSNKNHDQDEYFMNADDHARPDELPPIDAELE